MTINDIFISSLTNKEIVSDTGRQDKISWGSFCSLIIFKLKPAQFWEELCIAVLNKPNYVSTTFLSVNQAF